MKKFNLNFIGVIEDSIKIFDHDKSFGTRPLALIDTLVSINNRQEVLTLAFYRSTGTNSGKIRGKWYPISGIKNFSGEFTELTALQNHILNNTIKTAHDGWLVKYIFFMQSLIAKEQQGKAGYSFTSLSNDIEMIAEKVKDLYENNKYKDFGVINSFLFNHLLFSEMKFSGNIYTQKELHDLYIKSLLEELLPL